MKKFIYHITMALAVAFCLTACDDKNDSDYVPGEPTPANCMQVYFDADNAAETILTPEDESFDIKVSRKLTDEAAKVPIVVKSVDDAEAIQIPLEVEFAAGEAEATLTVVVKDLTPKKKYSFEIAIDELYADHYTINNGATLYRGSILVSQWKKVLEHVKFYYTAADGLPVTYSDVYQLEGVNKFYITNLLGVGADMYFKIDGMFDADNVYDSFGELVPEDGNAVVADDYPSDGYKLYYVVAGYDAEADDYIWNWSVGDTNIDYFYWYGGYSYSSYSTIDFTQNYIGLYGYVSSDKGAGWGSVYGVW